MAFISLLTPLLVLQNCTKSTTIAYKEHLFEDILKGRTNSSPSYSLFFVNIISPGTCKEVEKYNLPRLCIRKFFPKKKCFIFYPPTEWKKLSLLESLQENEIDSDFLQQVAEFCLYIFKHCKAKTLPGGIPVNGPREFPSLSSTPFKMKGDRNIHRFSFQRCRGYDSLC